MLADRKLSIHISKKYSIKILKILLAIEFILLTLFIAMEYQIPQTYYEVNIWSPASITIISTMSFILSLLLLVMCIMDQNDYICNVIFFLFILLFRFVSLLIPYLRGYELYVHGDILTHLGLVKYILLNGHFIIDIFRSSSIYPLFHIYLSMICAICEIPIRYFSTVYQPFICDLYILFMYTVYRRLIKDSGTDSIITNFWSLDSFERRSLPLAVVTFFICTPGMFGSKVTPTPYTIASMLFPLFILIFFVRSPKMILVLTILYTISPLLHPLFALFLIVYLAAYIVTSYLFTHFYKNHLNHPNYISYYKYILVTSIISFTGWIAYNLYLTRDIVITFRNLELAISGYHIPTYFDKASKVKLPLLQKIEIASMYYGEFLVILIVSTVFIVTLYRKQLFKTKVFLIGTIGLVLLSVLIPFFVLPIGFNPSRFLYLLSTPFLLLSGLFISLAMSKKGKNFKISCLLLVTVIVAYVTLSILDAYWSPLSYRPNEKVPTDEIIGTKWMLAYIPEDSLGTNLYDMSLGGLYRLLHYNLYFISKYGIHTAPDHFEITESDCYLITYYRVFVIYSTIYKELSRYTWIDYIHISTNYCYYKIYDTKGVTVWLINS